MPERSQLVLITGGGTGGHVFPGLAAAAALTARGVRVHWLGTRAGMESRLVPAAGIPLSFLRVSGVRGKSRWQQLLAPLLLVVAIAHALLVVLKLRPVCMLGTGGFVAGPGGIAAWLLRVPVVVHEQNAVAGTTNRLLARFAARILLGLPGPFASHPRARLVGNPVRAAIAAIPAPATRLAGRAGPLRLLVIGGSQGARVLNETLPAALALLPTGERPEVWHQGGARELDGMSRALPRARRRGAHHGVHRGHGRGLRVGRRGGVPRGRADGERARRRGAARDPGAAAHRHRRSPEHERALARRCRRGARRSRRTRSLPSGSPRSSRAGLARARTCC